MKFLLLLVVFTVLHVLFHDLTIWSTVTANVIGIDFASDSFKVAIVQPGTPLEIVNNFQSKRKTPTCITFYKGERMFGSDSYALMGRKPELSFANIYRMVGRSIDHPAMKDFKKHYFPYEMYTNSTSGVSELRVEDTHYTPEELIAMLLQHIKDMTLSFGGKAIKDCVITVPSSFTQHEREAVYVAADIADLKVLSLIEENTAAALHYALDRTFDNVTNVMYFNMGAGSIQVSIVAYSSAQVKEGGKNKTLGSFEVLSKAWDGSLGGFHFDVRLAELLADRFNENWSKKASGKGKDLRDHLLPMTKLRLQANKVKEILSANNEFPVKAEQLHADVDLNTKVTRLEFEAACEDLFARITAPIDLALARANLTLKDIAAVELLGGGVRMPKVKKIIDGYFSSDSTNKVEVGQHLNGDEAMAMGAAFRAANLSTAFRVRKVGATDISSFAINVRLESLPSPKPSSGGGGLFGLFAKKESSATAGEEAAAAWGKFTALYPAGSYLPSKMKTVAFQYHDDVSCSIEYSPDDAEHPIPDGTSSIIAVYNVTGVAAFAKEHESKGLGTPKVHLSFSLDSSGIVGLVKAEVTLELPAEPEPVVAAAASSNTTIEGDAAGDAANAATDDSAATTNSTVEAQTASPSPAANTTTEDASDNSTEAGSSSGKPSTEPLKKDSKGKDKEKSKKPKDKFLRRALVVTVNPAASVPARWTPGMVEEARQRGLALKALDDLRKATESALNDLEAYLYKVKNTIADKEEEFKQISTDEQRQEVVDMANAAEEWLYDEGRGQTIAVYQAKQQEIRSAADLIFKRHSEVAARKEEIAKAQKFSDVVKSKVATWEEKLPHITAEEKEKLLAALKKAEDWLEEKMSQQLETSPFETPVFESKEVMTYFKPVHTQYEKLAAKPKPAPPVVEKTNSSTNSSNSTGSSGEGPIKVEVQTEEPASTTNSTGSSSPSKDAEPTISDEL